MSRMRALCLSQGSPLLADSLNDDQFMTPRYTRPRSNESVQTALRDISTANQVEALKHLLAAKDIELANIKAKLSNALEEAEELRREQEQLCAENAFLSDKRNSEDRDVSRRHKASLDQINQTWSNHIQQIKTSFRELENVQEARWLKKFEEQEESWQARWRRVTPQVHEASLMAQSVPLNLREREQREGPYYDTRIVRKSVGMEYADAAVNRKAFGDLDWLTQSKASRWVVSLSSQFRCGWSYMTEGIVAAARPTRLPEKLRKRRRLG